MSALRDLLSRYREQYGGTIDGSKRVKGDWFEQICLYYFSHDNTQQQQFSDVWLWKDWPENNGEHDTGIDIVARLRGNDGTEGGASPKFAAIQCKFYAEGHTVGKPAIDSFLAASSKACFARRVIVSTSAWGTNAEAAIQNQEPPVTRINIDDMEASNIDWSSFDIDDIGKTALNPPKQLRDHQRDAIAAVRKGFKEHDRGKIIMACGTGKTFTALRIAEDIAGAGKRVLFLVPSIALLNQTLLAWNADIAEGNFMISFAVCSDTSVGRRARRGDDDTAELSLTDLSCPATTSAAALMKSWKNITEERKAGSMTVIFSTYQSLQVITDAQEQGFPEFDLVICDEAHRTTGVTIANTDESMFVCVHSNEYIKASKRLYMTATPRIYNSSVKAKAYEAGAELCSMDDTAKFGPEFYRLSFSEAVKRDLLTDYKVMIFASPDKYIAENLSETIAKYNLSLRDAAIITGCYKGLAKQISSVDADFISSDPQPMKTALAFAQKIAISKDFAEKFRDVSEELKRRTLGDNADAALKCSVRHVDGSTPIQTRSDRIAWLKDAARAEESTPHCRVLSNARCLSEGVDIPALDAIMFINPRKSQVDIVQSVGRVMRKAPGKKFGYVILPVFLPTDCESPEEALDKEETFQTVWQVLQALRAHDDRFNAVINSIMLNKGEPRDPKEPKGGSDDPGDGPGIITIIPPEIYLHFPADELKEEISVRMVQKCGDRQYWDKWARDMAAIAGVHKNRLLSLLNTSDEARTAFADFLGGLRENINGTISQDDAVDMLSQHIITKPVFDALFNENFSRSNPISQAMEGVLRRLEGCGLESETEKLKGFYDSVRERMSKVKTTEGLETLIKDLYEKFFRAALPKTAERLGIVYTPTEIVDFILASVDWALKEELKIGGGLSAENVHIIDPFVGTGTFVSRLFNNRSILPRAALKRKYESEIHANEMLLLAYYIASINIEMAYHGRMIAERLFDGDGGDFTPFPGIVLTDTFNIYEERTDRRLDMEFDENNKRIEAQRKTPITVIVGNPPYSVGQASANDDNQNLNYPALDEAIESTYAAESTAMARNSLYDSYIRAIRWATDRIKERGVICFVTNGQFLNSNSADGLRKCLCEDFQSIYIFNLRGNQYTSGETSRREGGKIFGSGSRLPVAITLLVKDPAREDKACRLFYHEVEDYATREEKLSLVRSAASMGRMLRDDQFTQITPNEAGDWISQRSEIFETFLRLGNKREENQPAVFEGRYSGGVKTNRDAWCYNFASSLLRKNMTSMISFYNAESERYQRDGNGVNVQDFVNKPSDKISWDSTLYQHLGRGLKFAFEESSMRIGLYRPYTKSCMYFNRGLNNSVNLMPSIFPTVESKNLVIYISGKGANKPFSALMTDCVPNLHLLDTGQCFPLYWYDELPQGSLFDADENERYVRRDAISDKALEIFRDRYGDISITKEDIFYYIYGVLSSPEYARRFDGDVKRMLARVPFARDFREFAKAGRELAELHVGYGSVEPWPLNIDGAEGGEGKFRVKKMKLITDGDERRIRYNEFITVSGIPAEAWRYIVNGKSALEWLIERYTDETDRDSGIRSDANEWSKDERYILDLIARVVRVSVETVRITEALPPLALEGDTADIAQQDEPERETQTDEPIPEGTPTMRALSVRQPWASAIISGEKIVEYRDWAPKGLGVLPAPLLICSTRKPAGPCHGLPNGVAIGIVDVVRVTGKKGSYEWHLENPRELREKFEVRGKMGIFNVRMNEEMKRLVKS